MIKVIFLDVDGVLNCNTTRAHIGCCVGVEIAKVKLLKQIVDATGAKIVLSSSWKSGWSDDPDECTPEMQYLKRKLRGCGLRIIDITRESNWFYRGWGIKQWCDDHDVGNFVILDDETFEFDRRGLMDHLVQTSFYDEPGGLQPHHVETAIRILNGRSV